MQLNAVVSYLKYLSLKDNFKVRYKDVIRSVILGELESFEFFVHSPKITFAAAGKLKTTIFIKGSR